MRHVFHKYRHELGYIIISAIAQQHYLQEHTKVKALLALIRIYRGLSAVNYPLKT
ncbi:MAG: hypothetical protein RMY34_28595 [Aulosira sp. DedQUE10]|nr:hypothetical protein [Aulosira sp. DedQUE10]